MLEPSKPRGEGRVRVLFPPHRQQSVEMVMRHGTIYLGLTVSALFWGLTFNVAEFTVDQVPALSVAALRFAVAGAVMLGVVSIMDRQWLSRLRTNAWAFTGMALTGVVGFNVFFFFGMQSTSAINGALIMATNPLVTALIAALFLREPISHKHKIGTAISFVGVAALILSGSVERVVAVNSGDLLVIGGNVCMALYSILNKRWVKESSPLTTTAVTTMIGAVVLGALAEGLQSDGLVIVALPEKAYAAIAFMGICGSVIAYIFWSRGIRVLGVADTAIFFHLVPMFAVLGSFLFGQSVTLAQVGAGAVVICGVMISSGVLRRLMDALRPAPVPAVSTETAACGNE